MDRGPSSSSTDAPSCAVSGSGSSSRARDGANRHATSDSQAQLADAQVAPPEHNIFGDSNLNMVMAFMLLLHFMQYAMRPPCGC